MENISQNLKLFSENLKSIPNKNIVSVSRRTDIPAFFGKWFFNRLKKGYAIFKNPFNPAQKIKVSLKKEDVICFVFWSKNFSPFTEILNKIRNDYNFVLHYTITGLPEILEPSLPPLNERINNFINLSHLYGKERLFWRFDPIFISALTPPDLIIKNFEYLAKKLYKYTARCYISFVDYYPKVERRLTKAGIHFLKPDINLKREILKRIKEIADGLNLKIYTCCEEGISDIIPPGSCVDAPYIYKIFNIEGKIPRKNPTRKGCGCYDSRDIGSYHTCKHKCLYCYAN